MNLLMVLPISALVTMVATSESEVYQAVVNNYLGAADSCVPCTKNSSTEAPPSGSVSVQPTIETVILAGVVPTTTPASATDLDDSSSSESESDEKEEDTSEPLEVLLSNITSTTDAIANSPLGPVEQADKLNILNDQLVKLILSVKSWDASPIPLETLTAVLRDLRRALVYTLDLIDNDFDLPLENVLDAQIVIVRRLIVILSDIKSPTVAQRALDLLDDKLTGLTDLLTAMAQFDDTL